MKQLKDLCLDCLALNLSGNITSVSPRLAPMHKQLLLERLMNHDRLTLDYLPHVTYNLFAPTMKHLVINRCAQVTDDVLELLSFTSCKLTHLSITGCKSVTGVQLESTGYSTLPSLPRLMRHQGRGEQYNGVRALILGRFDQKN